MVWTHEVADEDANTNSNLNANSNKNDKFTKCIHSNCNIDHSISDNHNLNGVTKDTKVISIPNSVTEPSSSKANFVPINNFTAKVSNLSLAEKLGENSKINKNIHCIEAEVHNEEMGPMSTKSSCNFKSSTKCFMDDFKTKKENVIIEHEVLYGNANCDDMKFTYNFKYKGHAKDKVNMLVHRHTL